MRFPAMENLNTVTKLKKRAFAQKAFQASSKCT